MLLLVLCSNRNLARRTSSFALIFWLQWLRHHIANYVVMWDEKWFTV